MPLCRKCKQSDDIPAYKIANSEFICRECDRLDRRLRYARNAWKRPPPQLPKRPEEVRAKDAAKWRRYWADPLKRPKIDARRWLNQATRKNRIKRGACEVCGAIPTQAHHDDYSKPLDVRWLCPTHHRELHRVQEMPQ